MKIRILTLALLLALNTALTACSGDPAGSEDSDNASDTPSAVQNIPPETQPEDTQAPETLPPETDPLPVEPPVTEPLPPETEPVPEQTPEQEVPVITVPEEEAALADFIGMTDSGQFVSEQSEKLKLLVDWEYVILDDAVAQVTVNIGISHYRLFANEKFEWGAVQVDGSAALFTTPAIEHDENTLAYTPFYSAVYTTDRSEMEVEAAWKVLGTYGGVEIDSLTAGGTIVFGEE